MLFCFVGEILFVFISMGLIGGCVFAVDLFVLH